MKLCSKFVKAVGIDGVTHFFHELQVIIEIVDRAQLRAQNFADPIQVMQVGPGKMTAGITLAGFIQRLPIVFVSCITYADIPETGEQPAVSGVTCRHEEVEHVESVADDGDNILGGAYSHQIVWQVGG